MSKNTQPTTHSWPVSGDLLPADPTASRSWPSTNENEPDYCGDDFATFHEEEHARERKGGPRVDRRYCQGMGCIYGDR